MDARTRVTVIVAILAIAIMTISAMIFRRRCETMRRDLLRLAAADDDNRRVRPASPKSPSDDDPYGDRRIPSFARHGIVIPDRSVDSRSCDDFANAKTCRTQDGYVACFECVESRHSLRMCINLREPLAVRDENTGRTIVLPANESPHEGYCLREQVARDIRDINSASDEGRDNAIGRAKHECSAYNADWLLVRRRTGAVDSTYNFVCRCKYPHLMANSAGPMSSCSRDVACNGHGHLDADAAESRSDPFVDGRCVCDNGWVNEYEPRAGFGPYCREATFAEWPRAFYGERINDDDIRLTDDAVSPTFRRMVNARRRDDDQRDTSVWLPNPCGACTLTRSPDGVGAYFCADRIELNGDKVGAIHIGVRRERDYLRGNGGRLPNACLTFWSSDVSNHRILAQYMSQSWNDGRSFAQEIGFAVTRDSVIARTVDGAHAESHDYRSFVRTLTAPKNTEVFGGWAVVWTYNAHPMRNHRENICRQLRTSFFDMPQTDMCYPDFSTAWYDYSYYTMGLFNQYFVLHRDRIKIHGKNVHEVYRCPDVRGLDNLSGLTIFEWERSETNELDAQRMGYALAPVCMVVESDCTRRPELNVNHNNPTGCLLFDNERKCVQYAYCLWYPRGMNILQYTQTRNISLLPRQECT